MDKNPLDQKDNRLPETFDRSNRIVFHQSDFKVGIIKPRNIDGLVITVGLAADRPTTPGYQKAWFATDTGKLSIWDGDSWVAIN